MGLGAGHHPPAAQPGFPAGEGHPPLAGLHQKPAAPLPPVPPAFPLLPGEHHLCKHPGAGGALAGEDPQGAGGRHRQGTRGGVSYGHRRDPFQWRCPRRPGPGLRRLEPERGYSHLVPGAGAGGGAFLHGHPGGRRRPGAAAARSAGSCPSTRPCWRGSSPSPWAAASASPASAWCYWKRPTSGRSRPPSGPWSRWSFAPPTGCICYRRRGTI